MGDVEKRRKKSRPVNKPQNSLVGMLHKQPPGMWLHLGGEPGASGQGLIPHLSLELLRDILTTNDSTEQGLDCHSDLPDISISF